MKRWISGAVAAAFFFLPLTVSAAAFETVSGTVTVRLNGVLVNAQHVSYLFAPEFPGSFGSLSRTDYGTYLLKADNVPQDRPYTLTISVVYDPSIQGGDGVIERRDRSTSGAITVRVPYGGDYDFGVRFLNLR